jgi:acetyltransferase-like isoleucine patch superfamily enzyme
VPAGKLVVGNPARILRHVPEEELLEND